MTKIEEIVDGKTGVVDWVKNLDRKMDHCERSVNNKFTLFGDSVNSKFEALSENVNSKFTRFEKNFQLSQIIAGGILLITLVGGFIALIK